MALIIEDGTGKPHADSYSTAAELVSYAARYGVTIPAAVSYTHLTLPTICSV